MDRGAWWATVHGVAKVRHMSDLAHTHTHTWDSVPGDVDSRRVTRGWCLPPGSSREDTGGRMRRKEATGAQSS